MKSKLGNKWTCNFAKFCGITWVNHHLKLLELIPFVIEDTMKVYFHYQVRKCDIIVLSQVNVISLTFNKFHLTLMVNNSINGKNASDFITLSVSLSLYRFKMFIAFISSM